MSITIITLYKQGNSMREIAKITKKHRQTVSDVITTYKATQRIEAKVYKRESEIEQWGERISELLSHNLSIIRIYEKLQEENFQMSYSSLSRYIRNHKKEKKTCIRFHTSSGEEAQVDFGEVSKIPNKEGKLVKAYIFNMRLSYSRFDYYEIVFDQKAETWIKCHMNAFKHFGGVPKVIKLDNLKAGVITANKYDPICQKSYREMADHYGCLLSPCRPYQPQEKGKVESGIKYVKNNFFAGRTFKNNTDMNNQLLSWMDKTSQRIHGTTKLSPTELFMQEKVDLIQLPKSDFNLSTWHKRKVQKDCHIMFNNNYYSVPAKYVQQEVSVVDTGKIIKIYDNNELLASHNIAIGQGKFITNNNHYNKYKKYCPGFKEYDDDCINKISKIGESCKSLLALAKIKQPYQWQKIAKGLLNLQKYYDNHIIDKACARAIYFGIYSYHKVKKIIESNSYNLPLSTYHQGGNYARVN